MFGHESSMPKLSIEIIKWQDSNKIDTSLHKEQKFLINLTPKYSMRHDQN
jgi:hypothetical protein